MANLIITVIAIALVAIASLMGAYYGGSAFLNNQSAANASTVLNQAQQISGAWNAYLSDNLDAAPTDVNQLVTSGYLAQIPIAPAETGGVGAQQMTLVTALATINGVAKLHPFAAANMGNVGGTTIADSAFAACERIIKTAIGTSQFNTVYPNADAAIPVSNMGAIVTSPNSGNGTFGCAEWNGDAGGGAWLTNSTQLPQGGDYLMMYLLQ